MKKKIELAGKKFGKWHILAQDIAETDHQMRICWHIKCDCGNTFTRSTSALMSLKKEPRYCVACRDELTNQSKDKSIIHYRAKGNGRILCNATYTYKIYDTDIVTEVTCKRCQKEIAKIIPQ